MGKPSAPQAPDYSPIATSDLQVAQIQQQTAQQQLDWAKQQWSAQAPTTQKYLDSMIANSDQQSANAQSDRSRYQSIYQPVEDKFVSQATGWNSPVRASQEAAGAEADVSNQFNAARNASLASLESYGIDPSQTRYGALDLGTRVSQAAATAAAGTQSRLNTQATGLALEGEAINIGKGYPGQVAQSYSGATNSGAQGIASSNNTANTYGSLMGTGTQWDAAAGASRGAAVGALNTGFQNQAESAQINNASSGNFMSGLGSLVGGALGVGALSGMLKL